MLRFGDRIKAVPGTVAESMSEGKQGTVVEIRDSKPYSGNDSNNLVRWDGETNCYGFRPEEVEKLQNA